MQVMTPTSSPEPRAPEQADSMFKRTDQDAALGGLGLSLTGTKTLAGGLCPPTFFSRGRRTSAVQTRETGEAREPPSGRARAAQGRGLMKNFWKCAFVVNWGFVVGLSFRRGRGLHAGVLGEHLDLVVEPVARFGRVGLPVRGAEGIDARAARIEAGTGAVGRPGVVV